MAVAVEIKPHTVELGDHGAIRDSLKENGYALVTNTATATELHRARELLWEHLDEVHGWKPSQPLTWTDDAYGPAPQGGAAFSHEATSGIMPSTCHSDCLWYVRTLPGVLDCFAAAYGTDDLVAAYDNMAINRPASCQQPGVLSLGNGRGEGVTHRWDQSMHNHFNQDGFGEDVYVCYAIMPLFDMNEQTGATAIVPGSHTAELRGMLDFVNAKPENKDSLCSSVPTINAFREKHLSRCEEASDPDRFIGPFHELGLAAGPVSARAGDLLLFDTAMFHAACPATDPGKASTELLRAICIMSMVPRLLLNPTIIEARQRAYEVGHGTGGSVMAREGVAEAFLNRVEDKAMPTERRFAQASPLVKKCVGDNFDFSGAPPQSRCFEQKLVDSRFPTSASGSVIRQTHRAADDRVARSASAAIAEFQRRRWQQCRQRL